MVSESNELVASFSDPVEMGIRVSSFEYAAGGTLRRGDTVDICATDEGGDEMSIRVYILKAFDNTGRLIEADDTSSVAVAFNVLLERNGYVKVSEILDAAGDFDLVKINDVR